MSVPLKPIVYVVDNDVSTRNYVRDLAERMDLACEMYNSGLEFLEAFDASKSSCLVLAVRIADISGPQIQRRLRSQGIETPLIFVSAHATVPIVVRVMREGALSVLEKPIVEQELWDGIQESVRLDEHRRADRKLEDGLRSKLAKLTRREHDVLELLLQGKTNRQIAKILEVSIRTIELRRSRLMEKLEARSLVELITIGMTVGNGFSGRVARPKPASQVESPYSGGVTPAWVEQHELQIDPFDLR